MGKANEFRKLVSSAVNNSPTQEVYNFTHFMYCNPSGLLPNMGGNLYIYDTKFGIDYRDYEYSSSVLSPIGINNAEKVKMCYQNFGMLIQTKDNKVIGTGHFKTNILKSYSEIEDLNGCDIDKLISTHIVYKSESEYKHTFAFAYIDTSNNSELIYYIPTIDTITNEEFEANIKDLFGYQKNMPFTSGYTIHRTGLINVDTIIQITDRCIILKTKDGKLHIHGKPFKIQSPNFVNKDYYIDTREIDNSHYNINEINILDYTNAFDQQGNAIFTELQNVRDIVFHQRIRKTI